MFIIFSKKNKNKINRNSLSQLFCIAIFLAIYLSPFIVMAGPRTECPTPRLVISFSKKEFPIFMWDALTTNDLLPAEVGAFDLHGNAPFKTLEKMVEAQRATAADWAIRSAGEIPPTKTFLALTCNGGNSPWAFMREYKHVASTVSELMEGTRIVGIIPDPSGKDVLMRSRESLQLETRWGRIINPCGRLGIYENGKLVEIIANPVQRTDLFGNLKFEGLDAPLEPITSTDPTRWLKAQKFFANTGVNIASVGGGMACTFIAHEGATRLGASEPVAGYAGDVGGVLGGAYFYSALTGTAYMAAAGSGAACLVTAKAGFWIGTQIGESSLGDALAEWIYNGLNPPEVDLSNGWKPKTYHPDSDGYLDCSETLF